MATTEKPEYAERMRILSLHGISRDAGKRSGAEGSWRYGILEAGYKYSLTYLQAALGLAELVKCDALCARRASIADRYNRAFAGSDAFGIPCVPENVEHAWHLYVLRVQAPALRIDRDRLIEYLNQLAIGTSVPFIPLHLHPLYQNEFGYRGGQFPNAEE